MPIEIKEVIFPPEVVEKIWMEHELSQWEVEHVVFANESVPRWDLDDVHGGRVVIKGETAEAEPRTVFVALRPVDVDAGLWACVTAFCPTDPGYGGEFS